MELKKIANSVLYVYESVSLLVVCFIWHNGGVGKRGEIEKGFD